MRRCRNCGEAFEPTDPRQRYCTVRCRNAMNARLVRRRKWLPRRCPWCGGEFVPITHSRTEYCCRGHKKAAHKRRRRPVHRERDRLKYQTDSAFRERKKAQVMRSHRKRRRSTPGTSEWVRAQLEALR